MAIHLIHGVLPHRRLDSQLDRLYVEETALRAYLQGRDEPYRPIGTADSDALTVDDSTAAGARACQVALELGHSVSFFVNPYNIVHLSPYSFSEMDLAFDTRTVQCMCFMRQRYDLSSPENLRSARNAVKWALAALPLAAHGDLIAELRRRLVCRDEPLPPYALPVSVREIQDLAHEGARIENHGWAHESIDTMTREGFRRHVTDAKFWLFKNVGVESSLYAVPFGRPRPRWPAEVQGLFLLADPVDSSSLAPGLGLNRTDISSSVQRRATPMSQSGGGRFSSQC
ncbi:putative Polysaccharide deacetylase [Bosea sp. 62]|nr:putative Polysaccharide deacetylase [Bosea sp. 46]CAD5284012.1 putative Polysaccharide deacetylase [Bosea sp. 7B]VVT56391.1 hypothetical protein BOS5A_150002 [Bosea sp. EC-HK365B]VXB34345.1 putative Polysaccharide deacetylase [Bosea sp. 29B]VXB77912.1 putative Polysaccharide deacetylase [Bosea sp. 125]VXC61352.1 putative Polysaccharide deacetylase [Bosea sp. 62]VXC90664.1 putative Polysaccharide deacetylase [Bosea sp. 127]